MRQIATHTIFVCLSIASDGFSASLPRRLPSFVEILLVMIVGAVKHGRWFQFDIAIPTIFYGAYILPSQSLLLRVVEIEPVLVL